jgi:hypothetical protein
MRAIPTSTLPKPPREQTGKGIDLVDVFRASEHVPAIVDDVIRLASLSCGCKTASFTPKL